MNGGQTDGEDTYASVQITNEHMDMWGIDEGVLYEIAMDNTVKNLRPQCRTIREAILGIVRKQEPDGCSEEFLMLEQEVEEVPMYVLSNHNHYYGAAAIYYPGLLQQLGEKIGSDLLILPSSVHEVMILPVSGDENYQELNTMIAEINRTQIAPEEVLADHLYYYDKEKDEMFMPC
jgi:hypothetical protein